MEIFDILKEFFESISEKPIKFVKKEEVKKPKPKKPKVKKPKVKKPEIVEEDDEPIDTLFKNMDILQSNRERLQRTNLNDLYLELIKNAIEYGNNLSIEIDDDNGIIVISNKISYDIEEITYKQVLDQLTTFKGRTEQNFNEGLTTLLLIHCKIRVKDFEIVNKYTNDLYFQMIDSKKSSHFINRSNQVIANKYFPSKLRKTKNWEITLFTKETEKIFSKELERQKEILKIFDNNEDLTLDSLEKSDPYLIQYIENINGFYRRVNESEETHLKNLKEKIIKNISYLEKFKDFHNVLKSKIHKVLDLFYIPRKFRILINGSRYLPDFPDFVSKVLKSDDFKELIEKREETLKLHYWEKVNHYIYNYTDYVEESEKETFYILWKINRPNFYHIVENNSFFNRGVKGFCILTANSHFQGESRKALINSIQTRINSDIEVYIRENKKKFDLIKKLNKYLDYKKSMRNYLNKFLDVKQTLIDQTFFHSGISKEERLILTTNYIHTFRTIFKYEIELMDLRISDLNIDIVDLLNEREEYKERGLDLSDIDKRILKYSERSKNLKKLLRLNKRVKLFKHPFKYSPQKISIEHFKEFTDFLELNFFKKYPDYRIGKWIYLGGIDTAFLSECEGISEVDAVDSGRSDITDAQIIRSENTLRVLYPTLETKYLINLKYHNPEDITGKKAFLKEQIQQIDILEDFNLNPFNFEEEIEKKEEELEDLKEKIEEEEEKVEENFKKQILTDDEEEKEKLKEEREKTIDKLTDLQYKEFLKEKEIWKTKEQSLYFFSSELEKRKKIIEAFSLNTDQEIEFSNNLDNEADELIYQGNQEKGDFYREISVEISFNTNEIAEIIDYSLPNPITSFTDLINETSENFELLSNESDINEISILKENINDQLDDLNDKFNIINEEINKIYDLYANISNLKNKLKEKEKEEAEEGEAEEEAEEEEAEKPLVKKKAIDVPKRIIKAEGRKFFLEILTLDDMRFPFLFNSIKDWRKWKDGKRITLGLTRTGRRYDAFSKAITLMLPIAEIKHPVSLVWFFDKSEDSVYGYYVKENGIVAINGYFVKKVFKEVKKKINQTFSIIDLVCHELAHDFYSDHNRLYISTKESLMHQARVHNVERLIRKIL